MKKLITIFLIVFSINVNAQTILVSQTSVVDPLTGYNPGIHILESSSTYSMRILQIYYE